MILHEKKSNLLLWILLLIVSVIIVLFGCCDFMPKSQLIENQIVHTAD